MIGVIERRFEIALWTAFRRAHRLGHLLLKGHGPRKGQPCRLVLQQPIGYQPRPFGMEWRFEGMEELVVSLARYPLAEADALLEGRRCVAHEVGFGKTEEFQGAADGGEGPLAHPDNADIGRF